MIIFLLRRVASGIAALLAVTAITFVLLSLSTGAVARNILGESASAEQIALKEAELGLDRPVALRFGEWLLHALQGDFGVSWFSSQPVGTAIGARLPVTLSLVVLTMLVVTLVAVLLGVAAAVRRGTVDGAIQLLSVGGAAIPQFVVAIILIYVFAINLRLLPATGFTPLTAGVGPWLLSLVLPVAALALAAVSSSAQQFRSATIKELGRDSVRTLRSRGLSEREILFAHVLRAAAPAGLTILSLQFIGMLSGSVVIEQIFGLPGIGYLAVQSTLLSDVPVLLGVVTVTVLIVIVVNLLVDLAVGWLNPKARVA